jgi:HAMP domain-containing protein
VTLIAAIRRDFVALIVVLGLLISAVTYFWLRRVLQEQFEQQGSFIATNLADAAAAHIIGRDILQLHTLVSKFVRLDGVAYVMVHGRDGTMLAHSLGTVPPELEEKTAGLQSQDSSRRTVSLGGKTIHESRGPILEGQLGTVRIGIRQERIEQEIYRELLRFMGLICLVLVAGIAFAVVLAGRVDRPMRRLVDIAGRMSTGDLDTPVRAESRDEFGELTHSLERMRASLKAAMVRLDQMRLDQH